jgi:hypothetical protein
MRHDNSKKRDDPASLEEPDDSVLPGLGAGSKPALSRSVQAEIGQRLRHFYDSLALGESPVPERFIEIINQLEESKVGRDRRDQH